MSLLVLAAACTDTAGEGVGSDTGARPAPETLPTLPPVADAATMPTTLATSATAVESPEPLLPAPETVPFAFESPVTPVPIEGASDLTIGAPELFDVDLSLVRQPSVSPTGRLAYVRAQNICIIEPGVAQLETCWDLGRPLEGRSLTWSPDEQTVVGSGDLSSGSHDITRVDVATGAGSVISGGESDLGDIGPFFDDDGILHFFRLVRTEAGLASEIHRVDGDTAVPTGTIVAFLPSGRLVVDGALVLGTSGTPGQGLVLLDLAAPASVAIAEAPLDTFAYRTVIDVTDGLALVVSRDGLLDGVRAALLDLRTGTIASINPALDDEQQLTGVALDPSGTRVAAIVEDRGDPFGHRLLVAEIGADGAVATFSAIATGEEFAPNGGDPTIRPRGFGDQMALAWSDGHITYAVGPLLIARVPIG